MMGVILGACKQPMHAVAWNPGSHEAGENVATALLPNALASTQ